MSHAISEKEITALALETLDDLKGQDIVALEVGHLTDIADTMIICHGTSNRHVKALANKLREAIKPHFNPSPGCEGLEQGDWILVDCGATIVHIMHPDARTFYRLEERWSIPPQHEA